MTTIPAPGMPGGPRSFITTWDAAYRISPAAGGKSALTVQVTNFEAKMPGVTRPASVPAPPRTATIQGTIDQLNRFQVPTGTKERSNHNWLPVDLIEFPSGPVHRGSVWRVALPPSTVLGDHPEAVQAKITGEKKVGKADAWEVTIHETKLPINQTVQLSMNGGNVQTASIKGTADLTIHALIEKGTGRTLELSYQAKKHQEMSVPGVPVKTPTDVEYAGSMRLKG